MAGGQKCTKSKYRGKTRAEAALTLRMAERDLGDDTRGECRAYLCERCGFWHLTSDPGTRKARGLDG